LKTGHPDQNQTFVSLSDMIEQTIKLGKSTRYAGFSYDEKQDLEQEVRVNASSASGSIKEDLNVQGWINRIADNVVIDEKRRQMRREDHKVSNFSAVESEMDNGEQFSTQDL